jgi:acyl carrier protein
MENLKQKLKEILIRDLKVQGVRLEDLQDDAPLFNEGLGLDSLDAVELVVLIQKYFNVQIADMNEGKEAFASINSLAAFIQKRQKQCNHA